MVSVIVAILLLVVLLGAAPPVPSRPIPPVHGDTGRYLDFQGTTQPTPPDSYSPSRHDHVIDPQDVIKRCLCPPGEGADSKCTHQRAVHCRACPKGFYSTAHDQKKCLSCRPCAKGEVEVAPCTATHNTVCMVRARLWHSCTYFRKYRVKSKRKEVEVENAQAKCTPAIEHDPNVGAPEGSNQLPSAPTESSMGPPLEFPWLLYVCWGTLGFLLVVLIVYLYGYPRRPISHLLLLRSWLLPSSTPVKRQADYFHAASSCYQIDNNHETYQPPSSSTKWFTPIISWVVHLTSGRSPFPYMNMPEELTVDNPLSNSGTRDYGANSSKQQRAPYSVYCPTSPLREDTLLDEHGFYKDTFSYEGGTLAHNSVAVTIPKLAIPEGHHYTIRGKTHTDIPNWKQFVDMDHGDVIIAPILECHVEGDFRLREHVTVCAPHCVHDARNLNSITVYCGDTRKGVHFKQIPHMMHKGSNSEAFYSADEQYVYIHTCDFQLSQFICTIGDRQIALQLQELVLYDHHLREDSQELKLKVKLCDSRNNIPDLRQAYFDQEEMRLVESCSWRRLELPNDEVTTNSEVSIELQPSDNWEEKKIGSMKFPLKMTHRLVDVLDSRNNLLGEFSLVRMGLPTRHFSGALLLRVTEKIEEVKDQSHTVLSEGPGGIIQRTQSSSHTIETNKSCNQTIPVNIPLDSQCAERWRSSCVPLQFAFDYISCHLTAANFPSFYRKLNFTEGTVDAIRERYRDDFKEQKMQVLLEWQQRCGKMASAGELLEMLSDIGLRKFAEDLQLEADSST